MPDTHPFESYEPLNDPITAMRVVAMPRETNPYGTIFGGVVLSCIDQAGFVEARRHGDLDWVTASIDRVDFHAPVHVGDVVSYRTFTTRLGRTSLDVCVEVIAERFHSHKEARVTTARLTMVGMREGVPFPFARCSRPDTDA